MRHRENLWGLFAVGMLAAVAGAGMILGAVLPAAALHAADAATAASVSTLNYDSSGDAAQDVPGQLGLTLDDSGRSGMDFRGALLGERLRRSSNPSAPSAARHLCSFSGETEVLMANGTTKPISEVEVGDWVLAEDPETGKHGAREVSHLWVHQDTIIDLEIDGHDVATTEDHPFWNHTDNEWQRADTLDIGDLVLTADGATLTVDGMDWGSARTTTAYNLTVDGIHTYYVQVGEEPILVHNVCPHAEDVLRRVDAGLEPPRTFRNDGRGGGEVLPELTTDGSPITYREWDVHPPGPSGRDATRVVTGSDGSAWFTNDHYNTFTQMRPGS